LKDIICFVTKITSKLYIPHSLRQIKEYQKSNQ
jgi:hypothetical protein